MAANKGKSSCSKCGKPFVGLMVVKAFAAVFAIYFFAMFFFNLLVAGDDWMRQQLSFMEPVMKFGWEYIPISIIFLIIGMPAIMAGIVPAIEKRHRSGGALACKECQGIIAKEQAEAAEMARAKQEAQAYAHQAKIEGLESNDPWMGKLIRSWKQDNPNKLPEESMIDELIMARNMEKAGNFEKAAVILEKYRFWEEAGRMRRLDDQKIVKHITVDMNELIDQVGTKGLAIPYKCSSCGASITIDKDSKKEGLKFCSYCGTAYNIDDMTKIIQHALE
ncbi:MAG TPA: hypothetical protein PLQ92_04860 [Methanomassiliicoccales archaeon]|nr:hypothetical protein [Methanomassiliicoccales archaeon]